MSKFLHNDDNNDAKAIAIPRVISENSRAKNEILSSINHLKWLFFSNAVKKSKITIYTLLQGNIPRYPHLTFSTKRYIISQIFERGKDALLCGDDNHIFFCQ